jgi:hypothetical protein
MANNLFNGQAHPSHKEVEANVAALASPVWVSQNAFGTAVTQVKQSTTTSNNLYWLNFSNSTTIYSINFVVTFKNGSPLANQQQTFTFPAGYGWNQFVLLLH